MCARVLPVPPLFVKREKVKKKKKKKKKKIIFFCLSRKQSADRKPPTKKTNFTKPNPTKHHSRLIQRQGQMHNKRVQNVAAENLGKPVGNRQIGARLNRVDCAV
jgi:hypothetical protein